MGVLDALVYSNGLRVAVSLPGESVLCHVYVSGSCVAAKVISNIKAVAADGLSESCDCENQSCVGGSVEIASVFFIGGEELKGQICTVLNQ